MKLVNKQIRVQVLHGLWDVIWNNLRNSGTRSDVWGVVRKNVQNVVSNRVEIQVSDQVWKQLVRKKPL